jgi:hypothetical protein
VKRIHHYHADGSALGGFIEQPAHKVIPSQAETSLPSAGGTTATKKDHFDFDGIVSCSSSETHTSGSVSKKSGGWSTLVISAVEKLNILNAVTADRVVGQISIEHPQDGYTPKVTFVGSQFVNLRIGGVLVEPVLNYKLLTPGEDYPTTSWLKNKEFLDVIKQQATDRTKDTAKPSWASEIFTDEDPTKGIDDKGYVLCSLVDKIDGKFPGEACGHVVDIPEVGKFYFGEVVVDHGSFRLTMIRAELGCPVKGSLSMSVASNNGHTIP